MARLQVAMNYLSVCSGIEAASVAWHPLGWNAVGFSEIEKFPSAVLAHHYPDIQNYGDMTKFKEWPDATVDVLVGGTPCQSFSVAGLRKGLADPRGNLMLTYLAIADKYRPAWLVWENVPGVLSSNGGRDFASFLRGLAELGYGFAYRVLDAQYFGVAQRRRRVFVVGCIGDWRRAAAVLFERHSLSGHPAPRREKGEEPAGTIKGGSGSRGYPDPSDGNGGGLTLADWPASVAPSLDTTIQKYQGLDNQHINGGGAGSFPELSLCLNAGAMGRQDWESETLIPTHGGGFDAIAFGWQNSSQQGASASASHTPTLDKSKVPAVGGDGMQVRRLTPTECARLQGFPDDYLDIIYNNKPAADGPKYKALGNSMAVPVMRWIGNRIKLVAEIMQ